MVFWEGLKLYTIYNNDYFEELYYIVLILLFVFLFSAFILLSLMFCSIQETKKKYTKWIVFALVILVLLIATWIIIYIKFVYKFNKDFVYVNGLDRRNNHPNKRQPHQHEPDDGYREHHN